MLLTALKNPEVYQRVGRAVGDKLKGRLSSGSPQRAVLERNGLVSCINQAQLCDADPGRRNLPSAIATAAQTSQMSVLCSSITTKGICTPCSRETVGIKVNGQLETKKQSTLLLVVFCVCVCSFSQQSDWLTPEEQGHLGIYF